MFVCFLLVVVLFYFGVSVCVCVCVCVCVLVEVVVALLLVAVVAVAATAPEAAASVWLIGFWFGKTRFLCVALAVLELALSTSLTSNKDHPASCWD